MHFYKTAFGSCLPQHILNVSPRTCCQTLIHSRLGIEISRIEHHCSKAHCSFILTPKKTAKGKPGPKGIQLGFLQGISTLFVCGVIETHCSQQDSNLERSFRSPELSESYRAFAKHVWTAFEVSRSAAALSNPLSHYDSEGVILIYILLNPLDSFKYLFMAWILHPVMKHCASSVTAKPTWDNAVNLHYLLFQHIFRHGCWRHFLPDCLSTAQAREHPPPVLP